MRKDLLFYSLFLVAGLGAAYYASTPQSQSAVEGKDWFSLQPDEISEIFLKGAETEVKVTRKGEKYFWVEYTNSVTIKDEVKTENAAFKANDQIDYLLDSLKPLKAIRVVGPADKQDTKEFGFDEEEINFKVVGEGKVLDLTIGKRSYGSRNVYAVDNEKKQVLLINGQHIQDLKTAKARLFESNPFGFNDPDVSKAVIKAKNLEASWDHTEKDKHGILQWREDAEGATPKPTYKNWMDKVLKLRVLSYATAEEAGKLEGLEALMQVEFQGANKTLDTIIIKKDGDDYWITSKFLGGYAKLSQNRMAPIEKDIPNVIGSS